MSKNIKVYEYNKCSTCRNAIKYLEKKKSNFTTSPIRDTPPSKTELKKMLGYLDGEIKKLFNTSGQDYRKLNIKDKIKDMTAQEAFELLSTNGNLVKRPFVLGDGWGIVGFKEENWKTLKL